MAHEINKRMQKDVVERVYLGVQTGDFRWPEIVLGLAEAAGRVIGESVDNGIQARELFAVAQRMMVQAAHTAHEAQKGNAGIILPE